MIQKRFEKLKYINKLDWKMVEWFIYRIEISKTEQIEVILNTDAMYELQIKTWNEKGALPYTIEIYYDAENKNKILNLDNIYIYLKLLFLFP